MDIYQNLKKIQKFRETGNLKNLCRNELDKACFAHDAACSDSEDLSKIAISDKGLKDRVYEIVNMMDYQRALASMVCKFFDKETGSNKGEWTAGWRII